ncbi:MAG: PhzF family phenazine biosynthesis protein [Chitinophagales bacterium]|nr:PhzF family phenazine biosynthesis protein [Chitinophagales bacterium]
MKLKMFQVDAFTDHLFGGNPAAVIPLDKWVPKELMQKIAAENNLSETAFYVPTNDGFDLRWFTPGTEVNLCGHATLAAAHVLFHHQNYKNPEIKFFSNSGLLTVKKENDWLTLNFPMDNLTEVEPPAVLFDAFNLKPLSTFKGKENYLVVLHSQEEVINASPNLKLLKQLHSLGVIITAKGNDVDFVSRFFAPNAGIDEDPVTGSAHTSLTPFWANELKKNELTALQVSKRGGYLLCRLYNERVLISGKAVTFFVGEIEI